MDRLLKDRKPVFWQTELELDVAGRSKPVDDGLMISVLRWMMNKTMEESFEKISSMFGGYETRLKAVESFVNSQGWNDRDYIGFDDYRPRSRFWTHGDCSRGGGGQKDPLEKDLKTGLENDPSKKDPSEKDLSDKDPEKDSSEKDPDSGVEKETQVEAEVEKEVEATEVEGSEMKKEPEEEEHDEVVCGKRIKKKSAALKTPFMEPPKKRKKN
ncbi:unnamed protein product [Arabis nemorensis]|uniref:Uncharacterized protein n=1 Tax=Arabis nemorensis TaxID=586526 RepID=A0A565CTL2_9BRAS|nr:unnamed protein product [Arabis nemorensis]